jgi:hypothetical protein
MNENVIDLTENKYFSPNGTSSNMPAKEPAWCDTVRKFVTELIGLPALDQEEVLTFLKNEVNRQREEKRKEIERRIKAAQEEALKQMELLNRQF